MRTRRHMAWVLSGAILATGAAHADVAISKKPTVNMNCSNGVCSPTASNAVLNTTDLTNMLASGDVKVTTGSGATNVIVKDSVGWATTSRLTLDANQSVTIDKPVMVTGTGAVTITTNDGGSGGDLIFDGKGNVTFWDLTSSLIVNGNSYTLVGDIATLASDIANNPSGFYALANDCDASADGTYGAAPVTTNLSGTFDGLNHKVDEMHIVASDALVGLFESSNGVLRDVQVTNATIQSDAGNGGVLVGSGGTIINCFASGTLTFSSGPIAGGLAGSGEGVLDRSHADVKISVGNSVNVGGLVGVSGYTITSSYATGNVKAGDSSFAGGLVGSGGTILESYATGNVSAGDSSYVGGLVGLTGDINNSYATGSVKGGASAIVGGFSGQIEGDVESSYSMGLVAGEDSVGFLGTREGAEPNFDYWDTDTSGKGRKQGCGGHSCGRGFKGLNTNKFQAGLPDGFDASVWAENPNINDGLPYLIANPPPK